MDSPTTEDIDKDLYRQMLVKRLEVCRQKNPSYSLRAYAKNLSVDSGTMSRILRGKQIPTYRMALNLAAKLHFSDHEEIDFLSSVKLRQGEREVLRRDPNLSATTQVFRADPLDANVYEVMTKWFYTAILELAETEGFKWDANDIAEKLGTKVEETQGALDTLLRLGLLAIQEGQLVKRKRQLTTSDKTKTSQALKENQRQFLLKALESLSEDPIEDRSMTSMVMAVDPRRLIVAKRMIRDFNQALCKYLEGGNRSRVYNLSVALHPLQKKRP